MAKRKDSSTNSMMIDIVTYTNKISDLESQLLIQTSRNNELQAKYNELQAKYSKLRKRTGELETKTLRK